jgi:hypothetical protein
MRFKTIAILAAFCIALAVPSLRAQTYDFVQPPGTPAGQPYSCGLGALNCDGIPFYLNGDNTQVESTVWIDLGLPSTHFACFPPHEANAVSTPTPLSPYGCDVPIDPNSVTWGPNKVYTSYGKTSPPLVSGVAFSIEGVGVMAINFGYYNSCGRYGCRWYTTITAATLEIGTNAAVTPDSPIAPTPTCLPGDPKGCPSKDWGN